MKQIYAIFDRVGKELVGMGMYELFVFRTDQQAVRYFSDCILDPKSILNKHPSDYELVNLGYIEQDNLSAPLINASNNYTVVITGDALIAATTEHTGISPIALGKDGGLHA